MPARSSADCTGNCSPTRAGRSARTKLPAIADADARENWQFVLAFRDLLLRHPTLEAAYLALVRSGSINLPPLFVNQLVHVILRNALDGCDDPFVLRAAELFFRPQRIMPHEQSLLLGDEEVIGGLKPDAGAVADVDAGRDHRRADRRAQRGERRQLLATQRPVRHGARSHRRKARTGCAGAGDDALDFPSARDRCRDRAADANCATQSSPGMSGSMPKPPGSATGSGMARRSTSGPRAACWRCSASPLPTPAWWPTLSGASRSI